MVQVYRYGADRKIEVSEGEFLLKLNFQPDVEFIEDRPSKVTGTLFKAGKHHALKEQLVEEALGQGDTEKAALLDLIGNLIANLKADTSEAVKAGLEEIKTTVNAEGLGFTHARYIAPSERS